MATSIYASECEDRLDPDEELDFVLPFSPMLAADETIESGFSLAVRPEAGLLGLTILGTADGYPDPQLIEDDQAIQLRLGIASASRSNAAFDNEGTFLHFEAFFTDSAGGPRNRTFKVKVVHG